MYTPNNQAVYIAAYAGALAGIGTALKVPSDAVAADYGVLGQVCGAFAQEFDTLWGGRTTSTLDTEAIEAQASVYWASRSPAGTSADLSPVTYQSVCNALIAMLTAGDSYFSGQGISPNVPSGLSYQTTGSTILNPTGAATFPAVGNTMWLRADIGVTGNPVTAVTDQSAQGTDVTDLASGKGPSLVAVSLINGVPAFRFTQAPQTELVNNNANHTQATIYAQTAWSHAVVIEYTGTKLLDTTSFGTCPCIQGNHDGTNPPAGVGINCGLKTGDPTKLQVASWFNNAGAVHFVQSPDLDVTIPHRILTVFNGTRLRIYCDALNPVDQATGNLPAGVDLTATIQLGSNAVSTDSYNKCDMSEWLTWNRALRGWDEVPQVLAWLKAHNNF